MRNCPFSSVTATVPRVGATTCTCAPEIGRFNVSHTSPRIVCGGPGGVCGGKLDRCGGELGDVGSLPHASDSSVTISSA